MLTLKPSKELSLISLLSRVYGQQVSSILKLRFLNANSRLAFIVMYRQNMLIGASKCIKTFLFIQAPSGDVYAKPIKKKPTPDSECQNGLQNDTYANMQGWK
jgi:hypothetical protein